MDEYATHLPVLKKAVEVFKPKKIIEHGCGDYSTPFLALAGELSFTEDDPHWATQVMKQHDLQLAKYYPRDDLVDLDLAGFDLAFIDGKRQGRGPSVQYCLDNNVPVIIYHDSHLSRHYGYETLVIPDTYHQVGFEFTGESRRGTTVLWTGDEKVSAWDVPGHILRDPYYFPTVGWGV
jgi:hypothetical protein